MDKKPNAKALLPIVVFLVLYLGCGIYFEYIAPAEGQMGFYVVSVVVAFVIALIVALLQNRSLSFDEKIHICARGIGDDNIVIMLFIFLMAGAFSGIASAAGGAESTANLFLDILPGASGHTRPLRHRLHHLAGHGHERGHHHGANANRGHGCAERRFQLALMRWHRRGWRDVWR